MRISDWSSDVCSSDLIDRTRSAHDALLAWTGVLSKAPPGKVVICQPNNHEVALMGELSAAALQLKGVRGYIVDGGCRDVAMIEQIGFPVWCSFRSEEHTSELQSLMRISYAVFCLKKKKETLNFMSGDEETIIRHT